MGSFFIWFAKSPSLSQKERFLAFRIYRRLASDVKERMGQRLHVGFNLFSLAWMIKEKGRAPVDIDTPHVLSSLTMA